MVVFQHSLPQYDQLFFSPGPVAQSVICLATDLCLPADLWVVSLIPVSSILSWRLIMK